MPRILLVDDDPDILETIELSLVQEHEVHTARDGQEALERIAEIGPFDVVVLDLMMPRMSGPELVWALRERGIDVAIVLTSAVHDLRERAASLGVREYLSKPFSLRLLRSKIASVAAVSRAGAPSPALAPALPIETERSSAKVGEERPSAPPPRGAGVRVQRCSAARPRVTRASWRTKSDRSLMRRNNNGS